MATQKLVITSTSGGCQSVKTEDGTVIRGVLRVDVRVRPGRLNTVVLELCEFDLDVADVAAFIGKRDG
jgi:hypothetical protein